MKFNFNAIFSVTSAAIAIFLKQFNFMEPVFLREKAPRKLSQFLHLVSVVSLKT